MRYQGLKELTLVLCIVSCAPIKSVTTTKAGKGDTRTKEVVSLDSHTYLLLDQSEDATYAFTIKNPVKVGGIKDQSGPLNERRFLNALQGPKGETIQYYRTGSCCSFKTPNGIFDNAGMLDHYKGVLEGVKRHIEHLH